MAATLARFTRAELALSDARSTRAELELFDVLLALPPPWGASSGFGSAPA